MWEESSVIDTASKWRELCGKQMLHIRLTRKGQRFKQDVCLGLTDCWVSTIKALLMKPRPSLAVRYASVSMHYI